MSDQQQGNQNQNQSRLPLFGVSEPPESSRDPLLTLREIAKDKDLDAEAQAWLFEYSLTRFNNRRKMAYMALWTLIGLVVFLALGTFIDGIFDTDILDSIQQVQDILIWAAGFLASIVATYFGMSSLRPSS